MSEDHEVYVLEAVANAVERLEEIHTDWLIEGGPGALEGDTLLLSVTQGQLTEDLYGGEFVTKEYYDALADQRDEGLAREAELRAELASASADKEAYGHNAVALRLRVNQLQQRLGEAEKDAERFRFLTDCPIRTTVALSRMADLNDDFDLAYQCDRLMPSPACAGGEKAS